MRKTFLLLTMVLFYSCKNTPYQPALIPTPKELSWDEGTLITSQFSLTLSNEWEPKRGKYTSLLEETGLAIAPEGYTKITLEKKRVTNPHSIEGAYQIEIGDQINILADDEAGAFYALQTLQQLAGKSKKGIKFPHCKINDWPSFKIRGFMHDNGRNYQSLQLLKEQIDVFAFYKMNVFHWHLTDNPGWRLESKIYPQLQDSAITSRKPGQFYTQEDFKEIVAYCKERHITVIPEFDIPGHTEAFRKAFGGASMKEPHIQKILLNLIDELCSLAPAEDMPFIHLGTDEVRKAEERVSKDFLPPLFQRVREHNREVITWWHGMKTTGDSLSISQLWASSTPRGGGHPFIDSRSNYINHLDPLAGMFRLFFQQPCHQPHGDDKALGGILCAWPDNRIEKERNVLIQNPVYPAIVFYSDAIWNGRKKANGQENWAILPEKDSQEFLAFQNFEKKVLEHRNRFFKGKEFQYLKQTEIPWKLIGPFDHQGDVNKSFPVEGEIQESYSIDGKEYKWNERLFYGGTIHLKHFFGFPSVTNKKKGTFYALTNIYSPNDQQVDFWIGFHGWSRAGGRRGGPTPNLGQWHTTNPFIQINGKKIAPPEWKNPGLGKETAEIPFTDEDYFYREPTSVKLKKGWNQILIKIPHGGTSWKWMFTCIPVKWDGKNVREVEGLKFSTIRK